MRAVCWNGTRDVRVEDVPDPQILNPHDVIVEVTSTAICGSDLHLYGGYVPSMEPGDILGHEFMGRVTEVGREVKRIHVGDRVVVPFPIACGQCWYCKNEQWSLCDNTNPNAHLACKMFGHTTSGLFGYSHLTGGYAGGQADYVRVPFGDVGCCVVEDDLPDDRVLFLGDILATAYVAAEHGGIRRGDVVAIWGAGPVGLLAIRCAYHLGAERVISLDLEDYRLQRAQAAGAETLNVREGEVLEFLQESTGGRGPDVCIEAVGMEAHGPSFDAMYDSVAQRLFLETERPVALRQAIMACRKGGTVSMAGVFGGIADKIPFGAAFNKALTFRMGQTHVHRYMRPLLELIKKGQIDPSFIISHRLPLSEAPRGYELFRNKQDECVKVVLNPHA